MHIWKIPRVIKKDMYTYILYKRLKCTSLSELQLIFLSYKVFKVKMFHHWITFSQNTRTTHLTVNNITVQTQRMSCLKYASKHVRQDKKSDQLHIVCLAGWFDLILQQDSVKSPSAYICI